MSRLETTQPHADPMHLNSFRINRIRHETNDTFTLELSPMKPEQPFSFAPGQFNMLYVFGTGEVPISMSGDSDNAMKLVHTVRSVGAVTQAICALKEGAVIGVRGPFGSAWPVEGAKEKDLILVAGGIGLAPLRPVLYHVAAHRNQYGRVVLLYGSRKPEDLLFQQELKSLKSRSDIAVEITVDSATSDWCGHVGVVTNLIPSLSFNFSNAVAMICGPEIMMRFSILALLKQGMPDENIFLSMERNMKCAVGFCGHCMFGPHFICKDGPVFSYETIKDILGKREI